MLDELLATDGVREIAVTRGRIVVMALHGGLERATYPLAEAIAERTGASLYAVVQPNDFWWHVPSTAYDPAMSEPLRTVIGHADIAVSLHGFGRPGLEDAVLLGGSHRRLAATLGATMREAGLRAIDAIDGIPRGLRGLHAANPVNLPRRGGVQIEMSGGVRRRPHTETIVDVVSQVLADTPAWSAAEPDAASG